MAPAHRVETDRPETPRERMIRAIAAMDDEAFSYLALASLPSTDLHRGAGIWPDGTGGFRKREAIEQLRDAARDYIKTIA